VRHLVSRIPPRLTSIFEELIDPANVCYVFVSPRQRAHKTFHLLFEDQSIPTPAHEVTEDVREWDYGELEGLKPKEIKEKLGENWMIWKDGCPGGESVEDITKRIDGMIAKVRFVRLSLCTPTQIFKRFVRYIESTRRTESGSGMF
jgi:hypothetical protein